MEVKTDKFRGLEYDFLIIDEITYMAEFEQKPLSGDWTGEPRWLREKRELEAARQLEKKLRHAMNYGYDPYYMPQQSPPEKPPAIGNYLYYFLGGPLNCTQEFHWSECLPRDRDLLRRAPIEPLNRIMQPDQPLTLESFTYRIITIPQSETPFSDVQVFLALYQG